MTYWCRRSSLHSPKFDDIIKLIQHHNPENLLSLGSQHNYKNSLCAEFILLAHHLHKKRLYNLECQFG